MLFSKLTLKLKAKTWNKNSHGLFDYETREYQAQSIDITSSSNISRFDTKLTCTPMSENKRRETEHIENPADTLATITESSEGIRISCTNTDEEGPNQFWQAVDKNGDKGYLLKVDDVIRFGRTMAKVRQIKVQEEPSTALSYQNSVFKSIALHNEDRRLSRLSSVCKDTAEAGTTCKICLGEQTEDEDPLISPCSCSGSMKYVHYKCLQNWMQSKLNMQKNKNIININWQRLQCELCKTSLELIIKHEGQELLLVPCSEEMMNSYALIEFFSKDNNSTGVYLIGLNMNSKEKTERFKIGRGQDCDFNTRDISVSRVHAYLFSVNGKLYLKDNSSRFGTLVLMKEPFVLSNSTTESPLIQCGRTCFKFTLHKPWTSLIPCFSGLFNQATGRVDESPQCQAMKRLTKTLKGAEDELDEEDMDLMKNQERDRRTMI